MKRVFVICSVFAFAGACGGDEPHPTIAGFTVTPATAAAGATVELSVEAHNFELAGDAGHDHGAHKGDHLGQKHDHQERADSISNNQGHLHVYFDSFEEEPLAMKALSTFSIDLPAEATPGPHTLYVRLHAEDHTIITPEVSSQSAITISAPVLPIP